MKEAVREAIEDLRDAYPSAIAEETGDGGAYVIIPDFPYGEGWAPATGWLGVTVPYSYPDAELYPFFGPPELKRTSIDSAPTGLTIQSWREKPVAQISLRQRGGWKPDFHTLYLAIQSIHNYLEQYK